MSEKKKNFIMFSYFSNLFDTKAKEDINIIEFDRRIRSEGMRVLILQYRNTGNKFLKKELPLVTFSGTFTKRGKKHLINHSGLICIDIDDLEDAEALKLRLLKYRFIHYIFISPSGNGLKVVIKIDATNEEEHKRFFLSLEVYFKKEFDIEIDTACKDLPRGCSLSYDMKSYLNENSDTLKKTFVETYFPIEKNKKIEISEVKKDTKKYQHIIDASVKRFMKAKKGKKHSTLLKQGNHLGYYVNAKLLDYTSCYNALKKAINERKDEIEDVNAALNTLGKGLLYGIENPKPVNSIKVSRYDYQFWHAYNGSVSIRITCFFTFLNRNGYWVYIYDKTRKLVKVTNNIVSIVEREDIADFAMKQINKQPYKIGDGCTKFDLKECFHNSLYFLTAEKQLNTFEKLNRPFLKDNKDCFYINYKNGVLKVTKNDSVLIPYKDIDELIWETSIIDREYKPTAFPLKEYENKSDFVQFIKGVTGDKNDKKFSRLESMMSIIGYLLHEHKDRSRTKAVIFCDEDKSGNPNGGTGKGIIIKAIQHFKRMVIIDGKNFNFTKSFAFQQVDLDTKILVFEDVKMKFNFEQLFSIVTEGITVEKKNKKAFYIPFEDAPKILITTNYMITGEGNSHKRRKVEIEFSDYYNEDHTPLDEFGRMLYEDWDTEQWQYFDFFMVDCMKMYLKHGIIKPVIKNIPLRKLRQKTNEEFSMFTQQNLSRLEMSTEYDRKLLRNEFSTLFPQFKEMKWFTQNRFNKWLRIYADAMSLNISERLSTNISLVSFSTKEK